MALTQEDTTIAQVSPLDPILDRADTQTSKTPVSVILFGHADADGYLATEQTRSNLQAHGFHIAQIVVSEATRNHRFWHTTLATANLEPFDVVVTVDIAFSFRNPDLSLEALIRKVKEHPGKQFIVIDHHALRTPREVIDNLTLLEVESAYDCCFGEPTEELMMVAALCEGDRRARIQASELHFKRALGIRRAAADVRGIAGERLLERLRCRDWDFFESLADEPAHFHRTARGRRTKSSLPSPILQTAMIPLGLAGSKPQPAP